jgi:methyl-accepting chemotaxis protein
MSDAYINFKNLAEPFDRTANRLVEATNRTQQLITNTESLVQGLGTTAQQMISTSQALKNSWEDYSKRFENVDRSLVGIFKEINDGLFKYTNQIREFFTKMDKHLADAIGSIGGATGELNETVDDLVDAIKDFKNQQVTSQ